MASHFFFDASALGKRYAPEIGTLLVNHLFNHVSRQRLACLSIGALEVVSILVRKKNGRRLSVADFRQAMTEFETEVLLAPDFIKITPTQEVVLGAFSFISKHSLNATDAVLVSVARESLISLRAAGDTLVVVCSDKRLNKACAAEGVVTFDPETQSQADLDALLAP